MSKSAIGFGSLVRCSLVPSECQGRSGMYWTGNAESVCRGNFREPPDVRPNPPGCSAASVRLVVILGTTDAYIKGCRDVVWSLYGPALSENTSK
jgi:hypothetical protein